MNHANVGARYIQVGSSAGPTSTINAPAFRNKLAITEFQEAKTVVHAIPPFQVSP